MGAEKHHAKLRNVMNPTNNSKGTDHSLPTSQQLTSKGDDDTFEA